jgi:hypothetical protein
MKSFLINHIKIFIFSLCIAFLYFILSVFLNHTNTFYEIPFLCLLLSALTYPSTLASHFYNGIVQSIFVWLVITIILFCIIILFQKKFFLSKAQKTLIKGIVPIAPIIAILFAIVFIAIIGIDIYSSKQHNSLIYEVDFLEQYLPQFVHYNKDTHFRFACIDSVCYSKLPKKQRDKLKLLLKRNVDSVFISESQIPDSLMIIQDNKEGKKQLLGFKDGYLFMWNKFISSSIFSYAFCRDYEGMEASSWRYYCSVWFFDKWILIWQSATYVS